MPVLSKKIVIFENIDYSSLLFVFYCIFRREQVLFFAVDARLENTNLFKAWLAKGKIERITGRGSDLEQIYLPHKYALGVIDAAYKIFSQNSKSITLMVKLLRSEMIHALYKKLLVERVYNFYIIHLYINEFVKMHKENKNICFVSQDYMFIMKLLNRAGKEAQIDSNIHIPSFSYSMGFISNNAIKALNTIRLLALPIRLLLRIRKVSANEEPLKEYQLGIRIYTHDIGFYYKYRKINFLLDGDKLNANNTLFCVETPVSGEYARKLDENKYIAVDMSKLLKNINWKFLKSFFLGTLFPYWARLVVLFFKEERETIKASTEILFAYITWNRFLELYHFGHYVVYNDFGAFSVVRNILFAEKEIHTWYYIHSCNDIGVMTRSNTNNFRDYAYSFMNYDTLLVWGDKMKRYQSSHDGYIREYLNIGCLWSEHIRIASEKNEGAKLKEAVVKKLGISPKKIIAVFDTSYGGSENLIKSKEIELFFEGIIGILDGHPDYAVILKNKWRWDALVVKSPDAKIIYRDINAHSRCYVINEDYADPNDVVAASDLVISICFTSPTVEALGARKKAIYYDATGIFKGYFYDDFPNLVAHGEAELECLVNYWLDLPDQEFESYLDTHIKGEIDAYVDGKAISRFRQELCKAR